MRGLSPPIFQSGGAQPPPAPPISPPMVCAYPNETHPPIIPEITPHNEVSSSGKSDDCNSTLFAVIVKIYNMDYPVGPWQ